MAVDEELATVLQTGSLKVRPTLESMNKIGAKLAGESKDRGMMAIIVALALVLVFMVIYFLILRPQARRQKEREAMLKRAKKGDRVVTSSGNQSAMHASTISCRRLRSPGASCSS